MLISYNWLKSYIPNLPDADALADIFTYRLCEVESVKKIEGDTVFDINILPNRAHDLLSHQGIARELAGLLSLSFADPIELYKVPVSSPTALSVSLASPMTRRYSARIIRNVRIAPSPQWVVEHLAAIGQRSINNIVDATNIVMYDLGNPCHAFDLAKTGSKIIVRQAREGETLELVGSEKIQALLKESDLVVANADTALAVAGVKGGTNSGISDTTTDIVLEVANFNPVSVRKTARRIGALSDSAKRFENDLSPELVPLAMRALTALVMEMCPEAQCEDIVDIYPEPQTERTLSFSVKNISRMLGVEISEKSVTDILTAHAYSFTQNTDVFTITVPALRLDLVGGYDIAEEIGRMYGYEKIPPVLPEIPFTPAVNEVQEKIARARAQLLADGYSETITYTFCAKGKVTVARGVKGKDSLRTNLSDGLKKSYEENRLNAPLLGMSEVKIFEIGTVFPGADGVEEIHVAYADKKGVTECVLADFSEKETATRVATSHDTSVRFTPWSTYPFIVRDIAVWVPLGTHPQEIISLCEAEAKQFLARTPSVFDTFTKEHQTSIAVRLVFQSHEKTLTDEEIQPTVEKIYSALQTKGFTVR
jgi:phenylalanyl-tRNA synthetase beta chain